MKNHAEGAGFADTRWEDVVSGKELKDVIISLTSYPARIQTVHLTIESLLNQTVKAEKIVLALGEDQFPKKEEELPEKLTSLFGNRFEILWTPKDLRSFTKLIPALKKYPDKAIIIGDDDIVYPKDWAEKLYRAYLKNPQMIHCHRAHRIRFDEHENLLPYHDWKKKVRREKPSFNNFATGTGGVLYPPHCLHKACFDEDVFLKICPLADDIWFWAMAVLNDTKTNVIQGNYRSTTSIEGTQDVCLWNINHGKNDEQFQKVLSRYLEIEEKLDKKMSFLQKLFSIRLDADSAYRIVRILGIPIRVKRSIFKKKK